MKYKCTGKLHIWGWTDFKQAINGNIVSYESDGGIIISITYEVEKPINKKVFEEFGIDFKIVS